jgi:hypothetical protein
LLIRDPTMKGEPGVLDGVQVRRGQHPGIGDHDHVSDPVPILEGMQDRDEGAGLGLVPSKQCTSSEMPAASTSSPIWICGSTRRSLLIPTLRSWSSFSISKYNVVQS